MILTAVTQWCCAPSKSSAGNPAGLFGWRPSSLIVGGSLYIKIVHLVGALTDHYHRQPYRAVRFNDRPRIKENIHKPWQGNDQEDTAKEYKGRNEITSVKRWLRFRDRSGKLWLGFRGGLGSDLAQHDLSIFSPIVLLVLLWYWHCNCIKMVKRKNKKS